SSNAGCAPIATPCCRHSATASRMLTASPAWPPQAMLADEIHGAIAASSPQPSPRSQLKSMRLRMGLAPGADGQPDPLQPLALFAQGLVGLRGRAGHEAQRIAGLELGQSGAVGADDVADARIAAVGLGVGQQHDRLAVG